MSTVLAASQKSYAVNLPHFFYKLLPSITSLPLKQFKVVVTAELMKSRPYFMVVECFDDLLNPSPHHTTKLANRSSIFFILLVFGSSCIIKNLLLKPFPNGSTTKEMLMVA